MTTATAASPLARAPAGVMARTATITWPLYAVLASSAMIVIGLLWDISWHKTIGRDTFWSPPHVLEQLGAIIAGISCGWLVLTTTFRGSDGERAASVRFWGFRGPLGAWLTIWGTFVMITSAPFDNWWHNAYGLDVKIVSPPHMVLAAGMVSIALGAMLMVLAAQNRATTPAQIRKLGWAYAFAGGMVVILIATVISEYSSRANDMHNARFYQVAAGALTVFLVAFARSGRLRFPATITALIYMATMAVMIWVLQLFPAQAKLAPIYNVVTHMIPPEFPLLLVVPAFAIDLLLRWSRKRRDWLMSVVLGVAFVLTLLAVQWFFGIFLLSPAARNFFFGADQWPYFVQLGDWQYRFWQVARDSAGNLDVAGLWRGLGVAAVVGIASARLGLWWGNGMSRVMR